MRPASEGVLLLCLTTYKLLKHRMRSWTVIWERFRKLRCSCKENHDKCPTGLSVSGPVSEPGIRPLTKQSGSRVRVDRPEWWCEANVFCSDRVGYEEGQTGRQATAEGRFLCARSVPSITRDTVLPTWCSKVSNLRTKSQTRRKHNEFCSYSTWPGGWSSSTSGL